ncbi:unnamed protein product [Arctia plantaginis]|uniref:Uncharacterized protein n=1 Tax=Arctia plantaginis TaxID=874455 RepID=A0A8S0YVB8_ARCPL|nr:unnamed protein product [Arctia plantaginis]
MLFPRALCRTWQRASGYERAEPMVAALVVAGAGAGCTWLSSRSASCAPPSRRAPPSPQRTAHACARCTCARARVGLSLPPRITSSARYASCIDLRHFRWLHERNNRLPGRQPRDLLHQGREGERSTRAPCAALGASLRQDGLSFLATYCS